MMLKRASAKTAARRALLLCALALAFGFIGLVAALADAVWFHLPGGVAPGEYVSVGRRASLSKRVEGVAAATVAQIREKAPEAEWLTAERLYELQVGIDGEGGAARHRLLAEGVSDGFFDSLGMTAAQGVLSAPPDVPAVVLGHAAWQRLFAGADVAGTTLTMPGEGALAIAGVAPSGFRGLLGEPAELWILGTQHLPSNLAKDEFRKQTEAAYPNKHVFGVLEEGMSVAKLRPLLADLSLDTDRRALGVTADDRLEITPGLETHPDLRKEVMSRTRWLVAIVVCMFVLALATLVDSLLAEQNARAEERRLRVAVGATPAALYGQCLGENAAAAFIMGLLAAAAGAYMGDVLLAMQPFAAWLMQLPPGSIALGCALGAGALALAYGLAAAYAVWHVALASRSTWTAERSSRSPITRRLLLLAATVSLLLIASVAERYWREADTGLGFAGEHALLIQVWADNDGGMRAPSETAVRDSIEALPLARTAARMDLLPLVQPLARDNWAHIVGDERFAGPDGPTVLFSGVKAAYFRTLGVPLLAGRPHQAGAEVVVSRSLAKRLVDFDADLSQALGQAIRVQREARSEADSDQVATVVGVVEDIAYGHYLDGERTVVYGDSRGAPWDQRWAIDHDGEAETVLAALREAPALEGFDVLEIGTPASLFRTQFMARRSVEILLASAACLALVLALAGIAASQARHLAEDRRAIGINLAVGASGWQLGMRYLDGFLVDFAIAAGLPCVALVAAGVVFPVAMSGVKAMLAPALIVPVLALVAALSAAIVCLMVQRYARGSPAALLHGGTGSGG